ncbi:MAG: phosphatase PAP2 family protein, partial [Solirubrobacterales bacterium]
MNRLDLAVYTAVATSPTPTLDRGLRKLSDAANYSRVSFGAAAGLAVLAGPGGRRAALHGVA